MRSFRWTAIALSLTLTSITLATLPSVARYRPSSNLQRPGGRQGAATRTPTCDMPNLIFEPIVPKSFYGETIAAYPTFYWYLANHTFSWIKFELYAANVDAFKPSDNLEPKRLGAPVYQTTFRILRNSPIMSFTLPSKKGVLPLKKGQSYLWRATLICAEKHLDDHNQLNVFETTFRVSSWITRIDASAGLQSKLMRSQRRYEVYAEEGLWYDAVYDLAVQRQQQPQQSRLTADWQDLLQETTLRSRNAGVSIMK